ncbi:MAG: hypothetical protein ABSC21_01340 [Terriglobia bacterium]
MRTARVLWAPSNGPVSPLFSRRIASAAKRHTVSSPATRDETYGKGSREIVPALEGPNVRRVNPVGVGAAGWALLSAG